MLRIHLPRSLYARALLIVILPIFIMQSVITYVFFDRHWDLVSANLTANVAGQISLVTRMFEETDDPARRAEIQEMALSELDLSVRFEPRKGIPERDKRSVFNVYNSTFDRKLDESLDNPYWFNTSSWPAYVEVRVQLEDGYLDFFAYRNRVFATTGPIFVSWLIGATILLGWIAIIFLRNQVRSILRLAEAAEGFGRGRDVPDFRPAGATEVRKAGYAFIAMRERIKRYIEQRTSLLAGVSHDLRTPLTRIKLALAMQPESPEIEALRADILEMEKMVEDYLDFARNQALEDEPELIDVGALLNDIAAETRRSGGEISLSLRDKLFVEARRHSIKRAVNNLVSNGVKYAGRVWVSARKRATDIEIYVDDNGPGVASENYEEVFKPFTRLDGPDGADQGGVGLGLALARDVARGHGGDVTLSRAPQGGLRAILRIPL
ncbi:MAG: ATP-binding protein [Parvularculaceae bacterium]